MMVVMDPAVDALLTAVDRVMNSNTLLLVGHDGDDLTELLRAADRQRGWYNIQSSPIVRPGAVLMLGALGPEALRARLIWMLTAAPSPYRGHLPAAEADAVADGFLAWLGPGWTSHDVRPDFLFSTGYYGGHGRADEAGYFDGGPSDTATHLRRGDSFMLLLTNGSP